MFRYAGRTAVRVVVTVLVLAALSYFGIGRADAATKAQAYDSALNHLKTTCASYRRVQDITDQPTSLRFKSTVSCYSIPQDTVVYNAVVAYFNYDVACPAGTEYRRATDSCVDPVAECLARNDDVPTSNTAIYTGQQCIDGCTYGARSNKTGSADDGTTTIIYGEMGYTGETCTTSTPNPLDPNEDRPESCTPAGGGMTMCIKDDGRHCYSATGAGAIATSKQICWQPGETGTKTTGPVAQTRGAGTNPPPSPTPPPGETFTPGTPKTTTTTTPGGSTITTTTINNTTINGTNAGDNDDAEGGDSDNSEGSASGGEGCDAPPTCAGDAVGCATLVQVWRTRCSPNKNKITGGAECNANGTPVFTCAGDEVMCKQALLQAEEICLARKGDANGDGQPDWTVPGPGDGTEGAGEDPEAPTVKVVDGPGMGMLDDTGFLGGASTCPTFGTLDLGEYGSFDLDEGGKFCDFANIVKVTLLLLGSFFAFQIIAGGRD